MSAKTQHIPTTGESNPQSAYRQFWPWFVFSLPAAAVIAGLITLWIAHNVGQNDFLTGYQKVGLAVVGPTKEQPSNNTTETEPSRTELSEQE